MRCAIYARYSSDMQKPESIHDQIRECRSYAEKSGWRVLQDHIYTDCARSGADINRDGYKRLKVSATRKSFDLRVQLEQPDPRLRAGMTAALRVEVERLPESIVIPAEAVFDKGGRTVAYVLANGSYEERKLILARRSAGQVQVEDGLKQGERIALKDPTLSEDEE